MAIRKLVISSKPLVVQCSISLRNLIQHEEKAQALDPTVLLTRAATKVLRLPTVPPGGYVSLGFDPKNPKKPALHVHGGIAQAARRIAAECETTPGKLLTGPIFEELMRPYTPPMFEPGEI